MKSTQLGQNDQVHNYIHMPIKQSINSLQKWMGKISRLNPMTTFFNMIFRFEKNEGIILLAATNRRDYLDSALLRPGRFDSEIYISPPDLRGRKEIFELYLSKVTHDRTTDTEYLAKGTTGFTGADIENMVNQVRTFKLYSSDKISKGKKRIHMTQ
jgi:SpoVK/Ycf46/Vps4 family AAA+-type ATPase